MRLALGIETSCDDCSVSVVKEDGEVLFLNQSNQDHIHKNFGGIVPELASRQHEEKLLPLIDQALKKVPLSQIDVICVTNRPGLLGSLLVGSVTAKILSFAWNKPLIGVNHIEAHSLSPLLFEKEEKTSPQFSHSVVSNQTAFSNSGSTKSDSNSMKPDPNSAKPDPNSAKHDPNSMKHNLNLAKPDSLSVPDKSIEGSSIASNQTSNEASISSSTPLSLEFPALAFIVSGGHSSLFFMKEVGDSKLLAQTRDDSAGEAFDKMARLLGFSWPGGPWIDKLAQSSSSKPKESFFSPIKTDDDSFSFSGIKSHAQRLLANKTRDWITKNKAQICLDYQDKIVSHLMEKLKQVFYKKTVSSLLLGGGVSANSLLRKRIEAWCKEEKISCFIPQKKFCMDNAAMIAFTGLKYFLKGHRDDLEMTCSPSHLEKDFFI